MKNKTLMILIPVLCLTLGTGRAAADDEGWYALGGFLGGVVATKVFDHHKSHHAHAPRHTVSSCKTHSNSYNSCQPAGYYKTVRVKVWIPGYWEKGRDRCGRRTKHFVPGYYTYEKERVWVSTAKKHRGHHSHRDGHQYASHHR